LQDQYLENHARSRISKIQLKVTKPIMNLLIKVKVTQRKMIESYVVGRAVVVHLGSLAVAGEQTNLVGCVTGGRYVGFGVGAGVTAGLGGAGAGTGFGGAGGTFDGGAGVGSETSGLG
jgi:hypothetical protein